MIELSTIQDLIAIFGVIAGFSYYILTVNNNQKNADPNATVRAIGARELYFVVLHGSEGPTVRLDDVTLVEFTGD